MKFTSISLQKVQVIQELHSQFSLVTDTEPHLQNFDKSLPLS